MTNQSEQIKKSITTSPQIQPIQKLIEKSVNEIGRALPAGMNPERVVRIALTCIGQNPELAKCTPESFIGSLLVLSQLGLEPIAGRAYLLPFNNKRKEVVNGKEEWKTKKECQAILGYRGIAELFYRHDASLSIDFQVVREGDRFEYQYGTNPFLNHQPKANDKGPVVGYYAVALLKGGANLFRYMTKEECMEHGKKHSKTWIDYKWINKEKAPCEPHFDEKSPWFTEPNSMCLKTVLIQLSKLLPLSVEMQRAISVDETSRDWREGIQDAISIPANVWQEEGADALAPKIDKPASIPGGLI